MGQVTGDQRYENNSIKERKLEQHERCIFFFDKDYEKDYTVKIYTVSSSLYNLMSSLLNSGGSHTCLIMLDSKKKKSGVGHAYAIHIRRNLNDKNDYFMFYNSGSGQWYAEDLNFTKIMTW